MKFVEILNTLIDQGEYGFCYMIADELHYIICDGDVNFDEDLFEYLCESAKCAYLKADDDVDIFRLCRTVYNMYIDGTLEKATAREILSNVWRY